MASNVVAVVLNRWFADGSGWAYHPQSENQFHAIRKYIENELGEWTEAAVQEQSLTHKMGTKVLLAEKYPDSECLDQKAARRNPSVLVVVMLNKLPAPEQESELRERMRSLRLPTQSGENHSLVIALKNKEGDLNHRVIKLINQIVIFTKDLNSLKEELEYLRVEHSRYDDRLDNLDDVAKYQEGRIERLERRLALMTQENRPRKLGHFPKWGLIIELIGVPLLSMLVYSRGWGQLPTVLAAILFGIAAYGIWVMWEGRSA